VNHSLVQRHGPFGLAEIWPVGRRINVAGAFEACGQAETVRTRRPFLCTRRVGGDLVEVDLDRTVEITDGDLGAREPIARVGDFSLEILALEARGLQVCERAIR
jgi:hypothetical protein